MFQRTMPTSSPSWHFGVHAPSFAVDDDQFPWFDSTLQDFLVIIFLLALVTTTLSLKLITLGRAVLVASVKLVAFTIFGQWLLLALLS